MNNNYLNRIYHFKGNPREIGIATGRMLGNRLEQTINHYIANQPIPKDMEKLHAGALAWLRSLPDRFQEEFEGRMENLIQTVSTSQTSPNLPVDLIPILADDQIERRDKPLVTVYSNVACPSTGEIWYTFGGYPAASKGNWQRLEWPWID
jgi:hypothetical protein